MPFLAWALGVLVLAAEATRPEPDMAAPSDAGGGALWWALQAQTTNETTRRLQNNFGNLGNVEMPVTGFQEWGPSSGSWGTAALIEPLPDQCNWLQFMEYLGDFCADDPSFVDTQGYDCPGWVGYDCTTASLDWDYSLDEQAAILAGCPFTCDQCDNVAGSNVPPFAERCLQIEAELGDRDLFISSQCQENLSCNFKHLVRQVLDGSWSKRPSLAGAAVYDECVAVAAEASVSEECDVSCPEFEKTAQHQIVGHDTEHLTSVTVRQCEEACCGRLWCKSFDYQVANSECYLSDKDATDHDGDLANGVMFGSFDVTFDHYKKQYGLSTPAGTSGTAIP